MIRRVLFCAAFVIPLLACTPSKLAGDEDVFSVSFSIKDVLPGTTDEPGTKVVLSGGNLLWNLSDTLGIFPQTGAQVYFNTTVEGSTQTTFNGGGWGFKNGVNYYSYYPFIGDIYLDRRHIPISFSNQVQDGVTDTNIGESCFMYTGPTSAATGSLNFEYFLLPAIMRVRATLPAGTYTNLAITAPSSVFVIDGWYDLMASTPVITPTRMSNQISTRLKNFTLTSQTQVEIYLMLAAVNLQGVNITVSIINSEQMAYRQQKTPSGPWNAGLVSGLTCNDMVATPLTTEEIVDSGEHPW